MDVWCRSEIFIADGKFCKKLRSGLLFASTRRNFNPIAKRVMMADIEESRLESDNFLDFDTIGII